MSIRQCISSRNLSYWSIGLLLAAAVDRGLFSLIPFLLLRRCNKVLPLSRSPQLCQVEIFMNHAYTDSVWVYNGCGYAIESDSISFRKQDNLKSYWWTTFPCDIKSVDFQGRYRYRVPLFNASTTRDHHQHLTFKKPFILPIRMYVCMLHSRSIMLHRDYAIIVARVIFLSFFTVWFLHSYLLHIILGPFHFYTTTISSIFSHS